MRPHLASAANGIGATHARACAAAVPTRHEAAPSAARGPCGTTRRRAAGSAGMADATVERERAGAARRRARRRALGSGARPGGALAGSRPPRAAARSGRAAGARRGRHARASTAARRHLRASRRQRRAPSAQARRRRAAPRPVAPAPKASQGAGSRRARASAFGRGASGAGAPRPARPSGADAVDLVGRGLVDLVDPVAVEELPVAAPAVLRRPGGVVVGEVVDRHRDRAALGEVAVVLLLERRRVVLEVVEHVEGAVRRGPRSGRGRPRRSGSAPRARGGAATSSSRTSVQRLTGTTKLSEKPCSSCADGSDGAVAEAAEGLGRQHVLGDAVEVVQHRHAAPADAHGRVHVGLGPVEDLAQLAPVADRLEVEVLDRRAGDDEAVEAALARLAERLVEGLEVRGGGVARLVVGHADQRQLDLQRRRADRRGRTGSRSAPSSASG